MLQRPIPKPFMLPEDSIFPIVNGDRGKHINHRKTFFQFPPEGRRTIRGQIKDGSKIIQRAISTED